MKPDEFMAWVARASDAAVPPAMTGALLTINAAGGWTWWAAAPVAALLVVTLVVFGTVDLDLS